MRERIINLRELGGYIGRNGLTVKKGVLFRSGNLDFPTEVLDVVLSPLDISVVFDLRSNNEIEANPYTLPDNILYKHRPILASLEENAKALNVEFASTEDRFRFIGDFMINIYREMGNNSKVFGDIIKEMILCGVRPVLFHCSAGKDRTGVLAAMILLALGVSTKDVIENYMLSNMYRKEEIELELQRMTAGIDNPEVVNKIKNMLLVKEEYIDATLKFVNFFSTFEDYAQSKLGLALEDLELLRQLYLE